ncbi:FAD/NAD-P-binding domain-containing protein [Mycena galericulata]|nr:FAD/NAD-P-binding domain-containing protein [Mycena galericulata]
MRSILFLLVAAVSAAANWEQIPLSSQTSNHHHHVFHHPIKRVAVIGAGPAGLQAAAKLIEHNFTVRLFERAPSPGGNWFYTDETPVREPYPDKPSNETAYIPSDLPATHYYKEGEEGISLEDRWKEHWQPRPLWDNLHTNSPAVITELPDVPYGPDTPWVLSNHDIQRHVRAYASFHNLNSNDYPFRSTEPQVTSYSTRVEKSEKIHSTQTWRLTVRKLTRLPETSEIKAQWWTEEFDAIVDGGGPYASAHVPDIRGIIEWSKVTEDGRHSIYHSQSYRRPERYQNKTILVVGASVSASEIAREIGPYVGRIIVSTRPPKNQYPGILRSFRRFPDNAEFVPEIAHFEQLDQFDQGIQAGKIHLVNGTVLHGIDEVILATGFQHGNIFFPRYGPDGRPTDLHWTGHWIPDPTLVYTNVRPWTIGRYQSYAFAKVWEGTARLPTQQQMQDDYDNKKYKFGGLVGTAGAEALFRQYIAWLNNESLVNGGRFVEPWPLQNREVYAYYSDVHWFKGYVTHENFTEWENTPARDWWTSGAAAWDAIVYNDPEW